MYSWGIPPKEWGPGWALDCWIVGLLGCWDVEDIEDVEDVEDVGDVGDVRMWTAFIDPDFRQYSWDVGGIH